MSWGIYASKSQAGDTAWNQIGQETSDNGEIPSIVEQQRKQKQKRGSRELRAVEPLCDESQDAVDALAVEP